jgi:hypothetical protein
METSGAAPPSLQNLGGFLLTDTLQGVSHLKAQKVRLLLVTGQQPDRVSASLSRLVFSSQQQVLCHTDSSKSPAVVVLRRDQEGRKSSFVLGLVTVA